MLQIVKRGDGWRVRLACAICGHAVALNQSWVAFLLPEHHGGAAMTAWIHRPCADGQVRQHFGVDRVTLLRGTVVLEKLLRETED